MSLTLFELLLLSLATYRLSYMLTRENAPFDLLKRLRERSRGNVFGQALECFNCTSVWVAVGLVMATDGGIVEVLAISGLAIAVDIYLEQ